MIIQSRSSSKDKLETLLLVINGEN